MRRSLLRWWRCLADGREVAPRSATIPARWLFTLDAFRPSASTLAAGNVSRFVKRLWLASPSRWPRYCPAVPLARRSSALSQDMPPDGAAFALLRRWRGRRRCSRMRHRVPGLADGLEVAGGVCPYPQRFLRNSKCFSKVSQA